MWSFGVQEIMSIYGEVVNSCLESLDRTMELNIYTWEVGSTDKKKGQMSGGEQ